ncbi:hypothetical protein MUCCIDRAFT_106239 [Mucor lusitanicus CBS 277.49]|uniref:Uncharacterized protein n=1 Tax=Mucor lusitanicus CBS 277.49 TaxID=747725 RepID=A0A162QU16_MUCCL|nr:hypothetical protein MUCCIDRAFT_106239 [Mucor lusitanicus CBS 277.49]
MAVDTQTTTETDSGTRTPIVNEIIDVDNYIYLNAQTTDESDSNTIASFIENDVINIDSRESSVARIPARHVSETTIPPRAPLPISLSLSATPETPIATIQRRVEEENPDASEAEKKRRYKTIFSAIAGAYLDKGEGKNDTLHCRKCKIFADKCGIVVLVLYDDFSKNFITRLINDEGINKQNVTSDLLSKRFREATIVNGEFTLAPEDSSVA